MNPTAPSLRPKPRRVLHVGTDAFLQAHDQVTRTSAHVSLAPELGTSCLACWHDIAGTYLTTSGESPWEQMLLSELPWPVSLRFIDVF